MLDDQKDDIFLSRWMNGELTEQELDEFKSHPEYHYYEKIMRGTDALQVKEYDTDSKLASIKSKRNTVQHKPKKVVNLWPYIGVAASIAIILGIFLFNKDTSYSSGYGEQLAVTLPDGSEMILNAKSTATFDKNDWKENRSVQLTGEAYFKVTKGSTFTVNTKNGEIKVLGTQFNVQSQDDFFEVVCYEGKVSVTNQSTNEILTAGKGFRNIVSIGSENWNSASGKPSWLDNTSSFRSVPLAYVIKELEEQYQLEINTKDINLTIIYTGTFPNNNKEIALNTVFSTLGMKYRILPNGKTVVLEK